MTDKRGLFELVLLDEGSDIIGHRRVVVARHMRRLSMVPQVLYETYVRNLIEGVFQSNSPLQAPIQTVQGHEQSP